MATHERRSQTINPREGKNMSLVRHYGELDVYKNAMELTMKVFEEIRKGPWPDCQNGRSAGKAAHQTERRMSDA
jgi:hypothetical protein